MMLSTLGLGLLLSFQKIPDRASVIYTGVPLSSSADAVSMVTHNAQGLLTSDAVTVQSTSYLKNLSSSPADITVSLPIEGHNVAWGMVEKVMISATVDGAVTKLTKLDPQIITPADEHARTSGIRAE